MPFSLSAADWPEVREALDVSLDASGLPDDVIGRDIFAGRATDWLLSRVPGHDDLSAADQVRARRAAIFHLASLLAPRIPDLISENLAGTGSYTRQAMDWPARARDLAADAAEALAAIAGLQPPATPHASVFRAAPGYRGRW